jgi:hypothetical protein
MAVLRSRMLGFGEDSHEMGDHARATTMTTFTWVTELQEPIAAS